METKVAFRFVLIILFGLAFVLVGFLLSKPLIFVSIPMISLVGFVILQTRQPAVSELEVTRTQEKFQIREDESCRIKLTIRNTGSNQFHLVQIRDLIPVEIEGEDTQTSFSIRLRGGESRELFYEVHGNYFGEYRLGPTILAAKDSTGLVESVARLHSDSKLVVFPKTAGKLSSFTIGPKTTRPRPGEIPVRSAGTGTDFFTTRKLLPGEQARHINWRASARIAEENQFLINEFVTHRVAETLVIVDCRNGFDEDKKDSSITTYSIRAAMSVAERLLRDKNRVGLFAIGAKTDRVTPGYGRRQFDKIALTLCRFTPGNRSYSIGNISYTVNYFYPRVSQIVLISPLMDDTTLETASELLYNASTYDLMILSPNPLDFPLDIQRFSRLSKSREGRVALKLASMERRSNISRLEASRAIILDWRVSEPLEQVIGAYRQKVARRIAEMARH